MSGTGLANGMSVCIYQVCIARTLRKLLDDVFLKRRG
jgi:hypothetical protein